VVILGESEQDIKKATELLMRSEKNGDPTSTRLKQNICESVGTKIRGEMQLEYRSEDICLRR